MAQGISPALFMVRTYRVIITQVLVTLFIAAGLLVFADVRAAYSALLGGAAGVVPNGYFVYRVGALSADQSPKRIVTAFYSSEAVKLILTVLVFLAAFGWLQAAFLPLFSTYVATLAVYWVGLIVISRDNK